MKTFILKTGLVIIFSGYYLFSSASYKDEITRLARIDLLPLFQDDNSVRQISSYDTTGGNDDGFSGRYSYLRKEGNDLIIADLKGTGVIQRIWTPTPTVDTIQFYFDGEKIPRIELKFIDLFSGDRYPFLRPVVGNEVGGYYCYLPIPYQSACKIVFKGKRMQFIQLQYREIRGRNDISSFPARLTKEDTDALSSVVNIWRKWGGNILSEIPGLYEQVKSAARNVTLKPGQITTVFSMDKGGRIVGIEITPQQRLNDQLKDLIIRARWDNEPSPAINCPVGDFFGYAFGEPSMQSLLAGVSDGKHYCYLPMPFDKKATIDLEYIKNVLNKYPEISINITIYYTEKKRATNEGKFYAEWKRIINPESGSPYPILNKTGKGHYLGTSLQAQGLNSGMTLFFEGDDVCYVDGELRLHGTGSEDYFNGGWYALPDRWDQAFSLPLHGCLAYSIPLARTGGYRFLLTDKISFEKQISLSIEHGPENNNIPVDYTSVAYYYCNQPPASNELSSIDLLKKVESPKMLEYWIQLLPVKALSEGAVLSNTFCKDVKTGKNYNIFKIDVQKNGYSKFELEVPSSGEYKLYISYLTGPECGPFAINQRQVPVCISHEGYANEITFIEKEYFGILSIKPGTNTITLELNDNPRNPHGNTFLLHRIYLEKNN